MLDLRHPSNEAEFDELMRTVDQHLRESDVPPHARPLRGWLEISGSLGLGLRLLPDQGQVPRLGSYSGDDLTIRIFDWFKAHYGDRLAVGFGPGRIFILLRLDPLAMQMPGVYGSCDFFASSTEVSSRPEQYLPRRQIPRMNVVDAIDGMTAAFKASLSEIELHSIINHFVLGFQCLSLLESLRKITLVHEAQVDINASVAHATDRTPNFGQSKWSSLQASEKLLKAFLTEKKRDYPKVHKLKLLAGIAQEVGLPPFDETWLSAAQGTGDLRYGERLVSSAEAFAAHRASLQICGHVARAMGGVSISMTTVQRTP